MTDNGLARFYRLIKEVDNYEGVIRNAKEKLKENYDVLVMLCPHSEAADSKSTMRGVGTARICKICGIVDRASEGGTPGDEYNYGYPGSPSKSFWKDAEVENVSKEEWDEIYYSRSHNWVVRDGKAYRGL